jgi:hypothetical protein
MMTMRMRNSRAGPRGKGKGRANGTRNKRAASKPPGRKKAASKKKKTKAAKEYEALISDLEHMRGRGGTDMTAGIKGSGLGRPPSKKYIPHGRGERLGVRSGCPSDGVATRSDVRKSFGSPQS